MARLPTPGGDNGNWGSILNEYLEVEHNNDGSHKADYLPLAGGTMSDNVNKRCGRPHPEPRLPLVGNSGPQKTPHLIEPHWTCKKQPNQQANLKGETHRAERGSIYPA